MSFVKYKQKKKKKHILWKELYKIILLKIDLVHNLWKQKGKKKNNEKIQKKKLKME